MTVLRTVTLALILGTVFAQVRGPWSRWPIYVLVMLWPTFGGHWVEVWYLAWLRPRLSDSRGVRTAARIGTWFVGGVLLALGMYLTAAALADAPPMPPPWWMGGLAFVGIELVLHLLLRVSGRPSFYDGRG